MAWRRQPSTVSVTISHMCRGRKGACSLLADPGTWDEYQPLAFSDDVPGDFEALAESIELAARGELGRARAAIAKTHGSPKARQWYIEHAQQSGFCRWRALTKGMKKRPAGERDPLAYPRAANEQRVFREGGHRCVYCQRRIISGRLLNAFKVLIGDDELFGMGKSNATTHGLVFIHRGVADHLDPRSNGGRTDLSNLVVACYACNFGKAQFTLDEIALRRPRPPRIDGWNGLEHLTAE